MNTSTLNRSLNWLKTKGPLRWLVNHMPLGFKVFCRKCVDRLTRPSKWQILFGELNSTNTLLARLLYEQAQRSPRFQEPKRLLGAGFKVYSQHDEDGVLEEIFRRVGTTNKTFIEFGVGDGLENCTLYLLLQDWQGAWIEGSAQCYSLIRKQFAWLLEARRLKVLYSFITAENIETLFAQLEVPPEPDLLSIDIDNNDYWVWKAITHYRPRVVAIEYNASFGPSGACVVPYRPHAIWDYTNYFGASLQALAELGREKGYTLVGCNYTGVTAFFVRDDLVGDRFAAPYTAENHHEPPRYYVRMPNGHPAGFGPTEGGAV